MELLYNVVVTGMKEYLADTALVHGSLNCFWLTGLFGGRAVVGLDSFQMWMYEVKRDLLEEIMSRQQVHMLVQKKFFPLLSFIISKIEFYTHNLTHLIRATAAAAVSPSDWAAAGALSGKLTTRRVLLELQLDEILQDPSGLAVAAEQVGTT